MKVVIVVGARPNFIKAAPIVTELLRQTSTAPWLVHTGQHYDDEMSKVFFEELHLPKPDETLGVGSATHAQQTATIMSRFEPIVMARRPDWVVVVGDVNSTLACALVASKLGVSVAHVEAGLRSFDRTMPEEINRIVTDAVSDLLLTPSADADDNLAREGVPPDRVRMVGNVMIDTLLLELDRARSRDIHDRLGLKPGGYLYVTLHRPSNVDDRTTFGEILDGLQMAASGAPVVFPLHPRTERRLREFGWLYDLRRSANFHLLPPVGYLDSIALLDRAACVITDSGGLQEESTSLGVPCLTLRPNTERPITITRGSNRLTTASTLVQDMEAAVALRDSRHAFPRPPLWDGAAAGRIVNALRECCKGAGGAPLVTS